MVKTKEIITSYSSDNMDINSQNDYNDPVPLDYDMDGDRKINFAQLVNPTSGYYTERLVIPVNNDPNLERYPSGSLVNDDDMDEDSTNNYQDKDMDADGMSDMYEIKYGELDEWLGDPDKTCYNLVDGKGWQNPFIYNARYAVLVGGDISVEKEGAGNIKAPMFWNDIKGMYDALLSKGWNDENIHILFYNGYNHDGVNPSGIIDGAIIYENWVSTISLLKNSSTKNDLLLFTATGHGSAHSFGINNNLIGGNFASITYDTGESDPGGGYLSELHEITSAKLIVVIEACNCGGAIRNNKGFGSVTPLTGPNTIIITASRIDRYAHATQDVQHKIFLDAFVTKLKESNVDIYDAFKSGEKATDDSSVTDVKNQDPQIEDNRDCLTSQNNDPNINPAYGGEYIPHTAVDGDQASKTYV